MKAAAIDIIDLFRLLSPQDIAVRSHTDAVRLPASLAASCLDTAQSGGYMELTWIVIKTRSYPSAVPCH